MTQTRRLTVALIVAALVAVTIASGGSNATATEPNPTASAAPRSAVVAGRIAEQNVTLLPALYARGGTLTADGKFVRMPNGTDISIAPSSLSDCPSGWVCLWSDASYSGRLARWTAAGTRVNLADSGFDNQMTSWANRGPYDARWFYNANWGGTTRCMNAGTGTANVGSTDNDQASSLAIYTDTAACS